MRAVVYHLYGSPDVLEVKDIDKPVPTADQILIRVHNASVNPYDWHFLRGTPSFIRLFTGLRHPKSPSLGADVAGEVEAIGAQVKRFKPGEKVFGIANGAFAQFAFAKEKDIALMPETATFEQAAAIPMAGITALQGLRDSGRLRSGQRVLINGAAGGVGSFAVQIAKHMGASVTGVCSTRNVDLVRSMGADAVIDYTRDDFTRSGAHFDVVFDLVGNRSLSDMRRALEPHGVLVGCGGGGPDRGSFELLAAMLGNVAAGPFISQRIAGLLAKINAEDLEYLAALFDAGYLRPVIDRTFPLAETAAAIRYVEQCHARGKVVVSVS